MKRQRIAEANGGKAPKATNKRGSRKNAGSDDDDEERILADARKLVSLTSYPMASCILIPCSRALTVLCSVKKI